MIQLKNLSKHFGEKTLFTNLNFILGQGQRVGLVGRNGTGKSTLFKLILGEESVDDGEILIPKGYKIGALKQHLVFTEKTLRDETALALSEDDKYSIYKVEKILFGLGFSQEDLEKDPLSFSGGYQIRINLAKLLITEPNLLLLDEPTNYLDILSLRWLKSFLKSFDGEVILITHDRDFMDNVCTHTMGIVRKSLSILEGNTHKFYAQLEANDEHYEKQKEAQDKKRKELEDFIAKNKARASTAAQAQSKVKLLEKMDEMSSQVDESNLDFDFNYKDTPAKVLLDVKDLSFGYTKDNILFKDISFSLKKGETLGIIGKNGKGKSTLLNTIAKELTALSGTIDYQVSTTFGHFGQTNIAHLNPNNTIMDEIYVANSKLPESTVRGICGSMMFSGDDVKKKISLLSGGEKSRVMLGQILAKDVNLLFLDEPTNHLDMQSIDSLTKAIKNFKGSSIIVTHSEKLLREVCDRLIVFSKNGASYFDGTYDEFLEKIGWDEEETEEKVKKTPKVNKKENKKLRASIIQEKNKQTSPLKKTVEKLETSIIEIEDLLEAEQSELIQASNQGDNSKIIELSQKISKYEKEIEQKFELLEENQLKLDEIIAQYDKKLEEL
ncbi:ABC-F family ATP-binding cassette domain-containing protein [Halarcobacter anaerophilus]|jgi:ATP-binding cassette subfamily F protein 3|uniref:ABC transporter ATP-binding protein n=1 Tax=Halarcobacter anaerophilus TaxID=877500 RepID=A0A4Q0Y1I6_9BACT|nr:ABC-F family ATP-binding cassette domain-containing protein [Halarcobacter anaerophilus]QDF28873.1 ABC transporter, ATP-binding protein [Halarcobacter anaerophilus]RXJ63513.1 ABC transporter ATP-binding protein [Halarcobacter anaerophilus]